MPKALTLLLLSLLFSGMAQAQVLKSLEIGNYEMTSFSSSSKEARSNSETLCGIFSLNEKDLTASSLNLGVHYAFETKASTHNTTSSTDPQCEYREKNSREDKKGKIILVRVNEEYCKGKLKSRATSTATLKGGEVSVRQETLGSPTYTCIWHN